MPTHHNPRSKQTNQAPLRTGPSHVDLRLPSCTTAQSQAETDRARADLTGTQLSGVDLIGTILFNVNPADVEDLPASNSARQTLPRNHSPENVRGLPQWSRRAVPSATIATSTVHFSRQ